MKPVVGKQYFSRTYAYAYSITVKAVFENFVVISYDNKKVYDNYNDKYSVIDIEFFKHYYRETFSEIEKEGLTKQIKELENSIKKKENEIESLKKKLGKIA